MKKYIYIAIVGVLTLSSCDDFLNKTPLSDLAPDNYFQDKAEMSNWNAGIYDAFQSALNQKQVLYGDVRSDNVSNSGYAATWIYMNAITPQRGECSWQDFFTTITRANVGIEKYPTIPNILESEYAPYIGQCYGMRALMYFWGTRVWGKMPIITKTWDGSLSNINVPRASLDEVKEQILSDIEQAIKYFTIQNTSDKYYLGLGSMYALRTEVYMWYKQYQDALNASDYFIGNSNYKLANGEVEWKQMFENPTGSSEVLFTMNWDLEADGANSGWPGQLGASNTNNGYQMSYEIFREFVDRLYSGEGADSRFWNTVDTVRLYYGNQRLPIAYATYNVSGISKCIKYSTVDPSRVFDSANQIYQSQYLVLNTTDSNHKLVLSRLANVMLLRAEALNQLGRGDEALDIVNTIRSRSGYMKDAKTEVPATNKTAVESLILLERQLEFFGEGQRWFDLMRTDRLIPVMEPIYSARQEAAGVTVTGFGHEGTKYWPVYYREFESNSALDQNPPYTIR
ncbi:RagB/SusD family nutrient uptake outer membrane protein [Bacteroides sp. UBA939]|uniref:RagB/SusD family nutrient uptake outer membrane protein n=1 Tax=Bacteroides sp. UBA939 TaxID=1946092 RepID=UPI0025C25524|nr:RagB/SusD family nutrient uptake outer membrane protein [Bacteroides sp. UBA939]